MDRLHRLLQDPVNRPVLDRLTAVKDDRDCGEQKHVEALREVLRAKQLLPPELDEYHVLLR